jgi:hypothetical protein
MMTQVTPEPYGNAFASYLPLHSPSGGFNDNSIFYGTLKLLLCSQELAIGPLLSHFN